MSLHNNFGFDFQFPIDRFCHSISQNNSFNDVLLQLRKKIGHHFCFILQCIYIWLVPTVAVLIRNASRALCQCICIWSISLDGNITLFSHIFADICRKLWPFQMNSNITKFWKWVLKLSESMHSMSYLFQDVVDEGWSYR